MEKVYLAEAIRNIQEELVRSQQERERNGEPALFMLRSVELEMQVALKAVKTEKGGIDIKIFAAQIGEDVESSTFHRVKIILDPVHDEGGAKGLPGIFPNRE